MAPALQTRERMEEPTQKEEKRWQWWWWGWVGLPGISKQATKESLRCLSGEHKGLACPARWHPAIQNAVSQKSLLVFTIYRSSLVCSSSHRELIIHRKVEADDSGLTRTSPGWSTISTRFGRVDCLCSLQAVYLDDKYSCQPILHSASQLLAVLATY